MNIRSLEIRAIRATAPISEFDLKDAPSMEEIVELCQELRSDGQEVVRRLDLDIEEKETKLSSIHDDIDRATNRRADLLTRVRGLELDEKELESNIKFLEEQRDGLKDEVLQLAEQKDALLKQIAELEQHEHVTTLFSATN